MSMIQLTVFCALVSTGSYVDEPTRILPLSLDRLLPLPVSVYEIDLPDPNSGVRLAVGLGRATDDHEATAQHRREVDLRSNGVAFISTVTVYLQLTS